MREFEGIIIANPNLDETKQDKLLKKYTDYLNTIGEFISAENLGIKKLAYPIRQSEYGLYMRFRFKATIINVGELEKKYRSDRNIYKFINVGISE